MPNAPNADPAAGAVPPLPKADEPKAGVAVGAAGAAGVELKAEEPKALVVDEVDPKAGAPKAELAGAEPKVEVPNADGLAAPPAAKADPPPPNALVALGVAAAAPPENAPNPLPVAAGAAANAVAGLNADVPPLPNADPVVPPPLNADGAVPPPPKADPPDPNALPPDPKADGFDAAPKTPPVDAAGAAAPSALAAGAAAPNGVEGVVVEDPKAPKPLGRAGVEVAPKGLVAGAERGGVVVEVEEEAVDWERAKEKAWSRLPRTFWTAVSAFCARSCSGCEEEYVSTILLLTKKRTYVERRVVGSPRLVELHPQLFRAHVLILYQVRLALARSIRREDEARSFYRQVELDTVLAAEGRARSAGRRSRK